MSCCCCFGKEKDAADEGGGVIDPLLSDQEHRNSRKSAASSDSAVHAPIVQSAIERNLQNSTSGNKHKKSKDFIKRQDQKLQDFAGVSSHDRSPDNDSAGFWACLTCQCCCRKNKSKELAGQQDADRGGSRTRRNEISGDSDEYDPLQKYTGAGVTAQQIGPDLVEGSVIVRGDSSNSLTRLGASGADDGFDGSGAPDSNRNSFRLSQGRMDSNCSGSGYDGSVNSSHNAGQQESRALMHINQRLNAKLAANDPILEPRGIVVNRSMQRRNKPSPGAGFSAFGGMGGPNTAGPAGPVGGSDASGFGSGTAALNGNFAAGNGGGFGGSSGGVGGGGRGANGDYSSMPQCCATVVSTSLPMLLNSCSVTIRRWNIMRRSIPSEHSERNSDGKLESGRGSDPNSSSSSTGGSDLQASDAADVPTELFVEVVEFELLVQLDEAVLASLRSSIGVSSSFASAGSSPPRAEAPGLDYGGGGGGGGEGLQQTSSSWSVWRSATEIMSLHSKMVSVLGDFAPYRPRLFSVIKQQQQQQMMDSDGRSASNDAAVRAMREGLNSAELQADLKSISVFIKALLKEFSAVQLRPLLEFLDFERRTMYCVSPAAAAAGVGDGTGDRNAVDASTATVAAADQGSAARQHSAVGQTTPPREGSNLSLPPLSGNTATNGPQLGSSSAGGGGTSPYGSGFNSASASPYSSHHHLDGLAGATSASGGGGGAGVAANAGGRARFDSFMASAMDAAEASATEGVSESQQKKEKWRKLFFNMRIKLKPRDIAVRCRLFEGALSGDEIVAWLINTNFSSTTNAAGVPVQGMGADKQQTYQARDRAEACAIAQELLACGLLEMVAAGVDDDDVAGGTMAGMAGDDGMDDTLVGIGAGGAGGAWSGLDDDGYDASQDDSHPSGSSARARSGSNNRALTGAASASNNSSSNNANSRNTFGSVFRGSKGSKTSAAEDAAAARALQKIFEQFSDTMGYIYRFPAKSGTAGQWTLFGAPMIIKIPAMSIYGPGEEDMSSRDTLNFVLDGTAAADSGGGGGTGGGTGASSPGRGANDKVFTPGLKVLSAADTSGAESAASDSDAAPVSPGGGGGDGGTSPNTGGSAKKKKKPQLASGSHVKYVLDVQHGEDQWLTSRRYREFKQLNKTLVKEGVKPTVSLPPKSMQLSSKRLKVDESRRTALQDFINASLVAVINHRSVAAKLALARFLDEDYGMLRLHSVNASSTDA